MTPRENGGQDTPPEDKEGERGLRQGRARVAAIWGVVYQGVAAGCQLVALGLIARHTGKEEYGLWMTVLAAAAWIPMAFLGQNSILMTRLGAVAHSDRHAASRVFSSSFFVAGTSSAILLFLLGATAPFVSWSRVLNADGEHAAHMAGPVTISALSLAIVTLPAMFGGFSVFAHQRGDIVHKAMSAGSLASLGVTAMAVGVKAPLWIAGSATLAGPLLGGLALWIIGYKKGLIPRLSGSPAAAVLQDTLVAGGLFFLIDAATLLLLRSPELIVARLHGTAAVGPLASVGRLLIVLLAVFQAVLMPFWPALGEASNRGDVDWIRRIARTSCFWVLGIWAAGATGLAVFGAFFIRLWTGSSEYSNVSLITAACAQSLGQGLWTWISVLLGSLSLQRRQVTIAALSAAVYLPLAFLAGSAAGPAGVAAAQAAALALCGVPAGIFILHRHLSRKRLKV